MKIHFKKKGATVQDAFLMCVLDCLTPVRKKKTFSLGLREREGKNALAQCLLSLRGKREWIWKSTLPICLPCFFCVLCWISKLKCQIQCKSHVRYFLLLLQTVMRNYPCTWKLNCANLIGYQNSPSGLQITFAHSRGRLLCAFSFSPPVHTSL